MLRPTRFLFASLTVCVTALGGGCSHSDGASETALVKPPAEQPPPQELFQVGSRIWPSVIRVQGSLLGDEEAIIGSKIAGKVEAVHVDLGDIVKKSAPLVTLESHELQLRVDQAAAQLAQACAAVGLKPNESEDQLDPNNSPPVRLEKALLDEARLNLRRGQELIVRNASSQQEIERLSTLVTTAEARLASALNGVQEKIALIRLSRAELSLAQQALADAQIVAPFDAIVKVRQTAPGEFVQPAQAVVTLVRVDTLRFTAGVPERVAPLVRRGQDVRISITGVPNQIAARVTRISPALEIASRSLTIEADVANPGLELRGGLFGEGEIVVAPDAEVVAIPSTAVVEFAGVEKVMVVDQDGKTTERSVRTGRTQDGFVEIISGLAVGDLVVRGDSQDEATTAKATDRQSGEVNRAGAPPMTPSNQPTKVSST